MKKYLAALLPGIIILFGGLQTALADERIDATEGGHKYIKASNRIKVN